MKNVLIINQSAELYGADKAILELIENYPEHYTPIVVLHQEGLLKDKLESIGVQVIISSVVKVQRSINIWFFCKLPFDIVRSFIIIKRKLATKKIDLIHSNATSVFIGAFYSKIFRIPHVWHVHEIIESPKRLAVLYPRIVNFFATKVVFNSNATANHFYHYFSKIKKKGVIIYNGQCRRFAKINLLERKEIRTKLFSIENEENKIVIGVIGRVSKIKGQRILIKAFHSISELYPNVHLAIIGSTVPGHEDLLEKLKDKVSEFKLNDKVSFIAFEKNIWPLYDSLDIVTVPSIEPESFGLVATEAMLSEKPLIVSSIGGLKEIVIENETGLFAEPNNVESLAEKMVTLIVDAEKRRLFGENGLKRVKANFSTTTYVEKMKCVYDELTR